MEVGGVSNIGPVKNISSSTTQKVNIKPAQKSDSLDISDFLAIRKSLESTTPSNEIKFKELKKILEEKGNLDISDEQLEIAINNFLDEIFS